MTDTSVDQLRLKLEASRSEVQTQTDAAAALSGRFMNARVLLFMVVVGGFFATAATGREIFSYALMLPALIIFILVVILHAPRRANLDRLRRLLAIIDSKLSRLDSEQREVCSDPAVTSPRRYSLKPAEPEAKEIDDGVLDDFAVFEGRAQLFGLINTTHTRLGRTRLADWLRFPSISVEEIHSRQNAARELLESEQLRHKVEQVTKAIGRSPDDAALIFMQAHAFRLAGDPRRTRVLLFSGLILGGTALALLTSSLALMGLSLLVAGFVNFYFGAALGSVPEIRDSFMAWRRFIQALPEIADDLAKAELKSDRLRTLEKDIQAGTRVAAQLSRGLAALSIYKAGLFYVVFSWLTLYDLIILEPLLAKLRAGREDLRRALDAIAELEALISLANLSIEQRGYVWPDVAADAPGFEVQDGLHPYLPAATGTANSIALTAESPVAVITGSNMTGKSTFLKMCGLNQLLAAIGAPVRARSMRTKPLALSSDINVRDSLDDGRSYFAVEVARIKSVLDDVGSGRGVLAILDEMFRGTNTAEKVAAGCEVVRWLAQHKSLSLVATHDAPFTKLEAEGLGIRNYHFSERIENDNMVFDHRLEVGPARTRNAIRVLEIAGYPKELVARAMERSKSDD